MSGAALTIKTGDDMRGVVNVAAVAARIEEVAGRVDGLSGRLDTHLQECKTSNEATAEVLKLLVRKVENIEQLPIKVVRWLAGIVVAAVVTLLTQNYILHQDTSQKATQAAASANHAANSADAVEHKIDQLTNTVTP